MQTNIPAIYAAGDCVETWHRVLQQYKYLPLGTTSHKQGRVAGENAVGGNRYFAGCVGTQVVKVFKLAAARTGLLDMRPKQQGSIRLRSRPSLGTTKPTTLVHTS